MGLNDSKKAIEKHISPIGFDHHGIIEEFKLHASFHSEPFVKEELMNIISDAIDNMDKFHYTDMIHAVQDLLRNIERKGGIPKLREERDDFLKRI
jgi:hypothetical protein